MAATKNTVKTSPGIKRSKDAKNFPITHEERQRLITELAFKKACERNFENGSPEQDWIEAEKEIDAQIHFVK